MLQPFLLQQWGRSTGMITCIHNTSLTFNILQYEEIKYTLQETGNRWMSFTTHLGFPSLLSSVLHPSIHAPIHPSTHPTSHPTTLTLMCVFYGLFVCSSLILHAASALLPLPSGILSGKHTSTEYPWTGFLSHLWRLSIVIYTYCCCHYCKESRSMYSYWSLDLDCGRSRDSDTFQSYCILYSTIYSVLWMKMLWFSSLLITSPFGYDWIPVQLLGWHVGLSTQPGVGGFNWNLFIFYHILLVCDCVHCCVHMFSSFCVCQGKVYSGAGHQGDRGGHQT